MDIEPYFPPVSKDLVDTLAQLFPDECPSDKLTDRQVWIAAGSALVVRLLRLKFTQQNETVLSL